jgi:hypothetical protein
MRFGYLALATIAASYACGGGTGMPMMGQTCQNINGTITSADGLTLRKPEVDAVGCTVIPNPTGTDPATVCMQKAPDLSCIGKPDPLGTPINVTFTGCVAAFGLDMATNGLMVSVFREKNADGSPVDPSYDLNGAPGMQADKTPSALLGRTISTMVPAAQCKGLGAFSIMSIPTETPLLIRVTDQQNPKNTRQYVDTYQYNIILRNAELLKGPMMDSPPATNPMTDCAMGACFGYHNANTVSVTTFRSVAIAAGVPSIMGSMDLYDGVGQGHIAGEVRDCTSQDKIQNAVVGFDLMAQKIAYFDVDFPPNSFGTLDDPKVEGSRTRTNADGLYAAIALDTPTGGRPVKAGAAVSQNICGTDGVCKCTPDGKPNPAYTGPPGGEGMTSVLGTRSVYAFPDSITIMTFDKNAYTTR